MQCNGFFFSPKFAVICLFTFYDLSEQLIKYLNVFNIGINCWKINKGEYYINIDYDATKNVALFGMGNLVARQDKTKPEWIKITVYEFPSNLGEQGRRKKSLPNILTCDISKNDWYLCCKDWPLDCLKIKVRKRWFHPERWNMLWWKRRTRCLHNPSSVLSRETEELNAAPISRTLRAAVRAKDDDTIVFWEHLLSYY